ncbi:receptor-like protein 54 [Corylus avellana]|uniref:receptor-like protein 54 n=1 Tax=Corylus avellana TaxID=13451 RepID=UPI00286BDEE3|nr:receptor-like protein 54 [Corylus avellana]
MDSYLSHSMFMRLLFLLSILFLVLLTGSLSSLQPLCHEDERSALLQFKDSFIINMSASYDPSAYPKVASWTLEGGNSDCCSWDGVECNEEAGHVIGLHLNSSFLYGSINSSNGLFRLLQLQRLNLADNHFIGSQIPFGVGNLLRLTYLNLSLSMFSGQIPSELSHISKLSSLDLSGHIPSLSGYLTHLTFLDLGHNNLEGTIPNSFSELKSVMTLGFRENNLSGMLEFDMFLKIKSLSVLVLSSNNLTLLTKANSNDTLPQFHTLSLGSCNLRKFPDFLRTQNKLSWLEMQQNYIQGLVPKWLYNISIKTFRAIILSDNFLIGFEQSPLVLQWSKLEILDLDSNSLQGSLPIPQPSIKIYHVQNNLIREMSSLICNLSSLYVLDLSYNNLRGNLHPCFGNLSSRLSALQLRSNNFHGTIPKTWVEGSSLEMIDLSENQFQGQLPRSMANCMMLEYLHVGNNQINDTFPFWLGNLSRLKVLVLSSNAFLGAIKNPEINYTFSGLHIIDISKNSFSGYLPAEYFLHWNAMKVVGANDHLIYMELGFSGDGWSSSVQFSDTLTNKGIELEYDQIQDVFKNSSFRGNPGLCGNPLLKKCGDFKYTPTPPSPFEENRSSESPFHFGWKVVAIGYGCGFVIGVVIGQIVITRKYDWFVKIFGKM